MTWCDNCREAEMIPVIIVHSGTQQPIAKGDYCPACGTLEESND